MTFNVPTTVSHVLVSGWYGNGNLGDEAILDTIREAVQMGGNNVELSFLSDDAASTRKMHHVRSIDRKRTFRFSRAIKELAALARHDVYVLGGGGLIRDFGSGPNGVESWLRPMRHAQSIGKRTMTFAVGADKPRFEKSVENIKRTLARCDVVTVRDDGSADALRAIDVQNDILVTADPAILVGAGITRQLDPNRPKIAVSLRDWYTDGRWVDRPDLVDTALTHLAAGLDALITEFDARIVFVPFQDQVGDRDVDACRSVAQRMSAAGSTSLIGTPAHPRDAAALFASCDLVIGMRLHSLILAASVGTPAFGLEYSPKVRKFLEHAGLAEFHVDLTSAAIPGRLAEVLRYAYLDRDRPQAVLERTMPVLRELALLNGALLATLAARHGDAGSEVARRIKDAYDRLVMIRSGAYGVSSDAP